MAKIRRFARVISISVISHPPPINNEASLSIQKKLLMNLDDPLSYSIMKLYQVLQVYIFDSLQVPVVYVRTTLGDAIDYLEIFVQIQYRIWQLLTRDRLSVTLNKSSGRVSGAEVMYKTKAQQTTQIDIMLPTSPMLVN